MHLPYDGRKPEPPYDCPQHDEEITRLMQWVHDLQSKTWINCVYCGHRYGPNDGITGTMQDALTAHIAQCPKHPLTNAKADIARLTAALEEAERKRDVYKARYADSVEHAENLTQMHGQLIGHHVALQTATRRVTEAAQKVVDFHEIECLRSQATGIFCENFEPNREKWCCVCNLRVAILDPVIKKLRRE